MAGGYRAAADFVRVAHMYYTLGLNQEQIAQQMGVSKSTVCRMLEQARKQGFVQIRVIDPFCYLDAVAQEVERRFGIRKAVVVPTGGNERTLVSMVGLGAARYVAEELLPGVHRVGLGWGDILHEMVNAIRGGPAGAGELEVVPLVGGMDRLPQEKQANMLCQRLAAAVGGECCILHAPALVSSREVKEALCQSDGVRAVIQKWGTLDLALVEIHPLAALFPLFPSVHFTEADLIDVVKSGAVGDMCGIVFDAAGREYRPQIRSRWIGVDLSVLARSRVVALAAGAEKARAVRAALRSGVIDTVIVDEELAESVLAKDRED